MLLELVVLRLIVVRQLVQLVKLLASESRGDRRSVRVLSACAAVGASSPSCASGLGLGRLVAACLKRDQLTDLPLKL